MQITHKQYAGPSSLQIDFGPLTIWFSYQTPVAFQLEGQPLQITQNRWAQTTGKHLNAIDPDKTKRIPYGDFYDALVVQLDRIERGLAGLAAMET